MTHNTLLYLAAFLFSIGFAMIIIKRNYIMILMGIELMFNAANVNVMAFKSNGMEAPTFALFVIIIAVCETAIGIAIILRIYRHYGASSPDEINDLKEQH